MTVYDISLVLGVEESVYPGDKPFRQTWDSRFCSGDSMNVSSIEMSSHSGTHIDIPFHYFDDRKSLESIPVEKFILPAFVVETEDSPSVTAETVQNSDVSDRAALLFKTQNSISGLNCSGKFESDFVYLSEAAAEECVSIKTPMVGIDYLSVDSFHTETYPVHNLLLQNSIFILENLNLKEVPAGYYTLLCLPIKIAGAEASPVRAVLTKE